MFVCRIWHTLLPRTTHDLPIKTHKTRQEERKHPTGPKKQARASKLDGSRAGDFQAPHLSLKIITCCRLGREQLSRPVLAQVWFHAAWTLTAPAPTAWLAGTALSAASASSALSASLSMYLFAENGNTNTKKYQ